MHFASPLPWWLAVAAAVGILSLSALAYRRPLAPLSRWQQVGLAALRSLTLGVLVTILARPSLLVPPARPRDRVVPVLVDVSRSMRVPDTLDGRPRIEAAAAQLERLIPELAGRFTPEVYTFGDELALSSGAPFSADARQSNLVDAIRAASERYRGRSVAGVIVLSDGAETTRASVRPTVAATPPVIAIGIGAERDLVDREVVGLSAGDPRLEDAAVDVKVSAVARGFGREPFEIRVNADGRLVEARRVVPSADGSPIDETFTVAPNPIAPTVVTASIAVDDREAAAENNQRSLTVSPVGRRRRVLAVAGAPGFDYSFMVRALGHDTGLDLDTVVRKGKDDLGHDTFLVQAGGGRAAALSGGFPDSREALFAYDALIVANMEGEFFTRTQLQSTAEFVSERGGGLLVLGGRSFAPRGLIGTPVEEALPVELGDRRGASTRATTSQGRASRPHVVVITADGLAHPVMRIGTSIAETERMWEAMPPLAASALLGGPRPGALVLAVTAHADGAVVPLVAAQRYGRGRAMVFGGEGSWRWKMMLPSTDRSYEYFWRQSARWLAGAAPDPVDMTLPEDAEPGDAVTIGVEARDRSFAPVGDAVITATLTTPGGDESPLPFQREAATPGRFLATFRPDRAGLFRLRAEARRGEVSLGAVDRWLYVGGSDRELVDPRMNEGVLRRLAEASGGRFLRVAEIAEVAGWLESDSPTPGAPTRRELWHEPWVYAMLVGMMAGEWLLRRRWGLR